LDLSFLKGRSYQATLIRDTGEAAAVKVEHLTLTSAGALTIDLRSGGGFLGKFAR
jgi:hypothetical protein